MYHNIVDYDDKGSVMKIYMNCSAGNSVSKVGSTLCLHSPVPLLLEAFDEDQDWAICKRTDDKVFSSFLEVCDERELPTTETFYVRVIHFPIKLLKETPLHYLEAHYVGDCIVQQYSNTEHTGLIVEGRLVLHTSIKRGKL